MNYPVLMMYAVTAVAVVSLAYGSYTDVRRRRINSLLFVPLMAISTAQNYYLHTPGLYIVVGILIFFFTFLQPDTYIYMILGAIFLVVSLFLSFFTGFYFSFQLILMSIVFLLGFQERLFGIGDIKGIVALMFASPFYSPLMLYSYTGPIDYSLFPTSMALLVDICVLAVIVVLVSIARIYRHGRVNVQGQPLAMRYSEELERKSPNAYQKREKDGVTYMVYRMPFIVPVALGYILFLLTGFFPAML